MRVGNSGVDQLTGLGGDDELTGGAGVDVLLAGNGNDLVISWDGNAEDVNCGRGTDAGRVDEGLDVLSGCETLL